MPAKKIVDEGEVEKWFAEGWTQAEMVEEYARKYDIEITQPAFANFRRKKGLPGKLVRNDDLIPWAVRREHRWAYDLAMLRAAARRRAGFALPEDTEKRLEKWLEGLRAEDLVIHYDPETEQGFFPVARRPDRDHDLIREPERKTTLRRGGE